MIEFKGEIYTAQPCAVSQVEAAIKCLELIETSHIELVDFLALTCLENDDVRSVCVQFDDIEALRGLLYTLQHVCTYCGSLDADTKICPMELELTGEHYYLPLCIDCYDQRQMYIYKLNNANDSYSRTIRIFPLYPCEPRLPYTCLCITQPRAS